MTDNSSYDSIFFVHKSCIIIIRTYVKSILMHPLYRLFILQLDDAFCGDETGLPIMSCLITETTLNYFKTHCVGKEKCFEDCKALSKVIFSNYSLNQLVHQDLWALYIIASSGP